MEDREDREDRGISVELSDITPSSPSSPSPSQSSSSIPPPAGERPAPVQDESEKGSVIDIDKALELFQQLTQSVEVVVQNQLTKSASLKKSTSNKDLQKNQDLEKGESSGVKADAPPAPNPAEFDIRTYFEDSVRRGKEVGHKPKRMGVVIKNLNVIGMGADAATIPDNLDIIKALWPLNWINKKKGTPFNILNDVSAFCRGGEMLLVLGRPGAGCSSFLRVVANERDIFLACTGDVSYGGIPANEFAQYAGETIYAPEEDIHFPTLTVKQTMTFALRTKTPGALFKEQSKRQFRQYVFEALMKMFGLVNQKYTFVGNEFVRGLSGGERKRATIVEAMVSRGAVDCWDCSTRGLDAASALDYAKSLRIITNILHKVTIASFYQASQNIYQQFDRVLLLDKGRCIYFGPTSEAKQYFLDLGFDCEDRKSTPDFLTGVTNPQERRIRPGFEETAPQSSVQFEAIFKQSPNYKRAMDDMRAYEAQIEQDNPKADFLKELKANKAKRARASSKYSASIVEQISALTVRQAQIFWGDKFSIFSRYFSVLVQSFIVGSVFYSMKLDAAGSFSRGGALFVGLILNLFLSQSALFATFSGRGIIQKQKSYAMYHPFAFHIAQSLIYSIITYWMFGLDADAAKFFIFLATFTLAGLSLTNLLRILGNISPSPYLSQQLFGVLFVLQLSYTGFFPQYDKMHPWLQWIFWIVPSSYAFKAFFTNEMKGLVFDCSAAGHVPFGPAYNNSDYRTCAIPGALPGETVVRGEDFIERVYHFNMDHTGVDCIILLIFWLFYIVVNALAVEKLSWLHGGFVRRVFKAGKAPKMNDDAAEAEAAKRASEASDNIKGMDMNAGIFLWDEIHYTVPIQDMGDGLKTRLLLDNVSGWIKPGQMTALMGSSGAGKTTLLDVLVKRKTTGVVTGTMLLNGLPLRIDYERITGYVEQMDVHNPFLTVREALQYSAKLRQEFEVSLESKFAYVEQVLEMMEMTHLGDALVGDLAAGYGISVEERKRLTIGMELVAKPRILFLDEPTSGLDAQSSFNIIKFIRKLANAGMPLVCTIHQPSPILFEYFDRLLLLAKGGKVTYFGDIGSKSATLISYFERNGARHCEEWENPAEYILESIGAGVSGKSKNDWVKVWRESPEAQAVKDEISQLKQAKPSEEQSLPREFATGRLYQMKELYHRFNVVFWRNPSYNVGRVLQALLVGLVIGFTYWKIGKSTSDIQLRVFAIFQMLVLGVMLIGAAMPQFIFMRELFKRDYSSKFYSALPFALTIIAVEIPYLLLAASVCMICSYWSTGLDLGTAYDGFYFWIAFVMFIFYCHSVGILTAAGSPNLFVAIVALPIVSSFLFQFAGVLNPSDSLPYFWRSWMYPLDPFHYFMEGIVSTALAPLEVVCNNKDFYRFLAPPNQTCGEYLTPFFTYGSGYLDNPDATGAEYCKYCLYKSGTEYLDTLHWKLDHRWRNFGILVCFFIFTVGFSMILVRIFRKQRR